ncbi:MAG: DUF3784 domain-containing protein [Oscillospiraceae bacterium]|nr:DUF3784 domain-containing protein [Oscillospiraceae bacterium]
MSATELITIFILFLLAFTSFVIGVMQFACRGPLLNNLYPAEQEDKPDPKPYYRQSGVVFLGVGVIMIVNAAAIFLHNSRLCLLNAVLIPVIVIYVIATAAMREGKK